MVAISAMRGPAEARHGAQAPEPLPEHGRHADRDGTAVLARRRYLQWAGSGLAAALLGSVVKPAEIRARDGTPSLVFIAVADGVRSTDEAPTSIRVEHFGDVDALAPSLTKGTQVYAEGRLTLSTWTGRDGAERTGLNIEATHIEVLGAQ